MPRKRSVRSQTIRLGGPVRWWSVCGASPADDPAAGGLSEHRRLRCVLLRCSRLWLLTCTTHASTDCLLASLAPHLHYARIHRLFARISCFTTALRAHPHYEPSQRCPASPGTVTAMMSPPIALAVCMFAMLWMQLSRHSLRSCPNVRLGGLRDPRQEPCSPCVAFPYTV